MKTDKMISRVVHRFSEYNMYSCSDKQVKTSMQNTVCEVKIDRSAIFMIIILQNLKKSCLLTCYYIRLHTNKYLIVPLSLGLISSLLGIESTRYLKDWLLPSSGSRARLSLSPFLYVGVSLSRLFIHEHTFSRGLRSRQFPGHLMRELWDLALNHLVTIFVAKSSILQEV
jgi:hypothetical protein